MRGLWVAVALLTSLALGGCLTGDDEDLPSGSEGNGTQGTDPSGTGGTVEGRILTQDLDPVVEACIMLALGTEPVAETLTDTAGYYSISNLDPGEYRFVVTHHCCKQHVAAVCVTADDTTPASVMLEVFESRDPYVRNHEWNGHVSCSVRIPGSGGTNPNCGALDPNQNRVHDFALEPGLASIVIHMDWDPVLTNPFEQLVLRFYKGTSWAGTTFFRVDSAPPIQVIIGPEDATDGEDLYFNNINSPWDVRFQVWVGHSPGLAYQQPFTVWYDLYYWEEAPEDASAGPG